MCDANVQYWAAVGIELHPGDLVTVVLDPDNLVNETDETNNTHSEVFSGAVPVSGPWTLLALGAATTFWAAWLLARRRFA